MQKRVTKGVISRLTRQAELDAQKVLTPDEELQLKWNQGINAAEVKVQRAMHSIDQNNEIDYAFDLTR